MDELYHVRVDLSIEAPTGGGALRISESLEIPTDLQHPGHNCYLLNDAWQFIGGTFMELAGILGEFYKVAEGLKAAKTT